MDAPGFEASGSISISLEAMEFEFALGTRLLGDFGFENCVCAAAAETGATVLFQMPAEFIDNCQRIAAVSCGSGADWDILLVILGKDGCSLRVERDLAENTVSRLADSYARLLRLAPGNSRLPEQDFAITVPFEGVSPRPR
jgi:hypothetical protein